jgi:choline oxidase
MGTASGHESAIDKATNEKTCDYLVIGGGTAGAIVAKRLADAGNDVILLESGPTGEEDDRVRRLSRWAEMLGTELDYDYRVQGMERGNDLLRYSSARVLGGCSAHNTGIAFQAPDWDLNDWASLGASGWDANACAPYFEMVYSRVNVEGPASHHPWTSAFVEAGESLGLPRTAYTSKNVREGIGWFQVNKRGDMRESSADAYLFPMEALPTNLTILTGRTVSKLLFDDNLRATGAQANEERFAANKEVVLCAGTFGSSKLLLLSGIGPASDLRTLGIEPIAEVPGVGQHLIDHPEGIVLWEAREAVDERSSHWESGAFIRLDDEVEHPELMAHFTTMRYDINTVARGYPTADVVFSMHPNVTRARSQGYVKLRSNDASASLIIDPRHYSDPDGYDERVVLEGIRFARRMAEQPALSAVIARELAPGPEVQSESDLSEYARRTGNTVYHPAGTCKMGSIQDPMAVVDPYLRVRGVKALRVADASIFPCMTTVNPCLTVMMIGERCADFMLTDNPHRVATTS